MRFRRFQTLALACPILLAAAPAFAQQPARGTPAPTTPASSTAAQAAGGVRLAGNPLRIPTIGLTMHVPEGSTSQTTSFSTNTLTTVRPVEDIGVFTIQGRKSTDENLTPKQVGDGIIEKILADYGEVGAAGQVSKSKARVLARNSSLLIGDFEADRFYIELPPKRSIDPAPVHGYTIVVPGPGRVIVIEAMTDTNTFEQARSIYETCVATANFADPGDLATRRAASIRAGVRVFEQLTPEDYRAVFESFGIRWERLYTAEETGADIDATEHGYRRLKAWVGRRGELNPDKDQSKWSKADQQPGYLLQIDALLLDDLLRVDTQAVYFMSMDREEEAWTVRMAIRQNGQTGHWIETGARQGHSMSVTTTHGSSAPTVVRPLVQGEGYLSMVETYMLPPLLAHAGIPADFAFYTYQSRDGTIRMRSDSVEHAGTNTWKITSRINEDAPPQTAYITDAGEPLSTELADGRVWEPTSYEKLVRLWRDKSLPLD
ncbi:MAG: hypothetical protein DHS20C14_08280 [Phycisphaeraceae bacterium]|nr:MAG: hypothetical protein DHS20C14_08280 [Phycisphaeraceae bacterium]